MVPSTIDPGFAAPNGDGFEPYRRDEETLARPWAIPGTAGLEHRIGGLEKADVTGNVSYDPENHDLMVRLRAQKVAGIAQDIPELEVDDPDGAATLVLSWGGTYGSVAAGVRRVRAQGKKVAHVHFRYLNPFPRNTGEVVRRSVSTKAIEYGRQVGGGTVHFTGNYWRFHESDFDERSRYGEVPGTSFADWPIRYADLEPYYTKAEYDLGISGQAGANPFEGPRSKPYPLPPMPVKSSGVIFERAARKLGLHPFPAPVAILSQPYQGRPACTHCGFCESFGCEMRSKSSSIFKNAALNVPTLCPPSSRTSGASTE